MEVRYAETDQMGVVHHGVYVVWMEAARVEFLKRVGAPYHELEQGGVRLPVVELGVTYRAPAAFGQTVEVGCSLQDVSSRAARFRYVVQRDGQVLAEGFTRHVCCDRRGRAVVMPEEVRRSLEAAREPAWVPWRRRGPHGSQGR